MAKFMLLLFLLIFAFVVNGQNQQIASVIATQYKITSQILGEERTILVRVPAGYNQTDAKFSVVYMLDAHPPQNAMMAGIIEQQAWAGEMPEMILVGIQNTDRTRDFTPTDDHLPGNLVVGGGEKFTEFIEREVIPLVEKNYRTQPFRIFAGHSLGGLEVVYSLVSHPALFNAYIAASPVLNYDKDYVIKRAEEFFKQKNDWNKTMFVALGNEPDLSKGFVAFEDLLKKTNPKNFDYEFRQFPEESHASSVLQAYYWGLRKIYADWKPMTHLGSVADLENHYKKLSDHFGYRIDIPETLLNQIGYQMLKANRFDEAVSIFKKNAENYPNSANVYDSLAEALEKKGELKEARGNYEKAFQMAESQGNMALAQSAKANYDRLSRSR